MELIQFIPEQLFIVIAVLGGVGVLLKNTPKVPDWIIPYILMIIGVVASISINGFTTPSILEGIIASFCSTGVNQLFKQYQKK